MKKIFRLIILSSILFSTTSFWGFYAHHKINRLAVFTLPSEMIGFYKKNIEFITEAAVNPDRRRFAVPEEAPRHYIDVDHFGDSAIHKMPRFWNDALLKYQEDTLLTYGILPWHINRMYYRLKEAFLIKDPDEILRVSAELGHYIADAHVPLHTTENHNGQRTGQDGIHAFWESRLPELFSDNYNFFVGSAKYIANPQLEAWRSIVSAHRAVDSVLTFERTLSAKWDERKYSFETKGKQTIKVYSPSYSNAYHTILSGMVERQMRASIKMIGDFWYSAWVDAGQPDLKSLIIQVPTKEQLEKRRLELEHWKQTTIKSREHENQN